MMKNVTTATLLLAMVCSACVAAPVKAANEPGMPKLTSEEASHFVELALKCVQREYPNKLDHVLNTAADVEGPRKLHPAFYGCFDWHSTVHGHWMLVRLLRLFPKMREGAQIRATLNQNLSKENLQAEANYFSRPLSQSFERTYGWAWALKLSAELRTWKDPDAEKWYANMEPLANVIAARLTDFLPKQTYPIRTGVHPNTAFGLAFVCDYAQATGNNKLERLVVERSRDYYAKDADYPSAWEPGGEDFLSPGLEEADLMRRVLEPAAFADWFHKFLPQIEAGGKSPLLQPAIVGDRSDPKLVHLDGLNLSRSWCMEGIAKALPADDPARRVLLEAAARHAKAALPHIASGNYMGEHWLATFAVYMLTSTASGEARAKPVATAR